MQVDEASNEEDLNEVMQDEFLVNSLVNAGWLTPVTPINRYLAMQTLIVHDVLIKRKATMDQFIKGLEVLDVHGLIKSNPKLMEAHFVSTQAPLTSVQLIDNFHFEANIEHKMAKQFLIQAIQNLEKGLCLFSTNTVSLYLMINANYHQL